MLPDILADALTQPEKKTISLTQNAKRARVVLHNGVNRPSTLRHTEPCSDATLQA